MGKKVSTKTTEAPAKRGRNKGTGKIQTEGLTKPKTRPTKTKK
jgi:hypothetical protein